MSGHGDRLGALKPPLSIRHVTDEARAALDAGRRSHDAFTVRRCQIVLARAEGRKPAPIATTWHCAHHTGRHVIHAVDERGLACGPHGSHVPLRGEPVLNAEKRAQLRAMLPQRPRTFGPPARVWTRQRLAEVCHEQGVSDTTPSCPTIWDAIVRLGVRWPRAKPWMVRPEPADERKKNAGTA